MDQEQIEKMCRETADKEYQSFLFNNGWKFETGSKALEAYSRMEKSKNGTPLTMDEFLVELGAGFTDELARQLYKALYALVEQGALTAFELYQYAKFRWCRSHPEAVVAYQTGPHSWKVNTCDVEFQEERAKLLINSEWGFEASRIELRGTPYYDATDWNFIHFSCGPLDWLMQDGELYQIYQ